MKIYIVRHGQTEWNKEKRMQGAGNSDLTELGIEEAKKLGEHFKNIDFDMIYSSPLGRTVETMEYIKGNRDIPVKFIEELQEMDFGHLEGRVMEEAKKEYGEMIDALWTDPINYKNETGESFADVFERVEKAFNEIISNDEYENVMVVTHGVIISVLFTILSGKGIAETWDIPVVANTSVSIIEIDGEDIEIITKSDTSHLEN